MPILEIDQGAAKQLKKLHKKDPRMQGRYDKTKKAFDANHLDRKLDFKKHKSMPGVFKIVLLGIDDGRRLMLLPDTTKQIYYVYDIVKHDDL